MNSDAQRLRDLLLKPAQLWRVLSEYFRFNKLKPVTDADSLKEFINTRASYMAQTSLYGYLRTRAGMRYPELFDDDFFVRSINIAKWQLWLACVSDLAVYAGGLILQRSNASAEQVGELMQKTIDELFKETGIPEDAGDKFADSTQHVRQRLALCDWSMVTDDEQPFSHSPQALVEWAPIVDDLKQMDAEIVINSVRYRWQKVRRELRQALNTAAIFFRDNH